MHIHNHKQLCVIVRYATNKLPKTKMIMDTFNSAWTTAKQTTRHKTSDLIEDLSGHVGIVLGTVIVLLPAV